MLNILLILFMLFLCLCNNTKEHFYGYGLRLGHLSQHNQMVLDSRDTVYTRL